MKFIQFLYIIILWGLPILLIWHSFRKMTEEKREQVREEINTLIFWISVAPIIIGLLLFLTSSVSAPKIKVLEYFGIGLLFVGWAVLWGEELINRSKRKGIGMIAIGGFVLIIYICFFNEG